MTTYLLERDGVPLARMPLLHADAFAVLAAATGATPLRLHDVLVWLSGSLRLTHAVALGRASSD